MSDDPPLHRLNQTQMHLRSDSSYDRGTQQWADTIRNMRVCQRGNMRGLELKINLPICFKLEYFCQKKTLILQVKKIWNFWIVGPMAQKKKSKKMRTEFWGKIQCHYLKEKKRQNYKKKACTCYCSAWEKLMSEGGSKAAPCLSTFWPGCRYTQSRFINLPHTIDIRFMCFKGLNALSWTHVPHVGLLIAALQGTQNKGVAC